FHLSRPESFLGLFARGTPPRVELGEVDVAEAWALVGLSVLARRSGSPPLEVGFDSSRPASQFAYALGLQDVIEGRPSTTLGERGRTARLRRVRKIGEVESAAREIAELLVPSSEDDDSRATTFYVLVELLRNAVQHSGDPNGGVVAAQLMREGYAAYPRPVVQVAVGDAGVGLPAALQVEYPEVTDPEAAVVKALEPHVSGAFRRGLTGSTYNAGMGLFMISEMAKLTAGRFLLATRGATLWLRGNLEDVSNHQMDLLPRLGFPGTLVAFELPFGEPADHDGLVSVITQRASERTPSRDTSVWVRFEAPPPGTDSFLVSAVIEDVERAHELSRTSLQPLLFARKPIALDFRNMRVCTQSFLHALLFEAIRLSWATQTPIYVEQASPGVETGIRLVDNYARGG
ncbi:MAG: ATP-binding protein, partial [Polyangiales bacterium]